MEGETHVLHNSIIYSKNGGVIELVESRKHVTWSQKDALIGRMGSQSEADSSNKSESVYRQIRCNWEWVKCEKKGGHDWGWLGLFCFLGLSNSRVIVGWNFGVGIKMDPNWKGGFGFTGNGRALWEAKRKREQPNRTQDGAEELIPPIITQSVSHFSLHRIFASPFSG